MRKILNEKVDGISRLERLVKGIRTAMKNNIRNPDYLRTDILNAPHHIFGQHDKCGTFCNKKSTEVNLIPTIEERFFLEIKKILEPLVSKANQLSYNHTTNQAERYMSLVAKFSGGKRVNYTKNVSFSARAHGAALSHLAGPSWHTKIWKTATKKNPESIMQRVFLKRQKKLLAQRENCSKRKRPKKGISGPDIHYGPEAAQPDIPEEELKLKKEQFLVKLKEKISTEDKRKRIEEQTRGQHEKRMWHELRLNYLTASTFGTAIERKSNLPCHNLVKIPLYKKKQLNTAAVIFGREKEKVAMKIYEEAMHCKVNNCGLFIDEDNPLLAASPDGIVGEDGLIEVKCLYSINEKL
ncbi:uncharacterized protein [Leptinotarsa decemlineata]|uniref:uncharacterized protein n=1 Tax=Leptinotarsa decemlineata TaxID=7539 RepID=UPI003D30A1D9